MSHEEITVELPEETGESYGEQLEAAMSELQAPPDEAVEAVTEVPADPVEDERQARLAVAAAYQESLMNGTAEAADPKIHGPESVAMYAMVNKYGAGVLRYGL